MSNVSNPRLAAHVNGTLTTFSGVFTTTHAPVRNVTVGAFRPRYYGVSGWDDATWILSSAFIIFTMQSGFGLLEAGMASQKNEVSAINTRGEGDSHADMTGMLVEIFKSNP